MKVRVRFSQEITVSLDTVEFSKESADAGVKPDLNPDSAVVFPEFHSS